MRPYETAPVTMKDDCTLKQLAAQIIKAYQPVAHKQNSEFINNIPDNLKLDIDEDGLAVLMGSMLYTMASCSRDSRIDVSAEYYADVILLNIKDANTFNSYAIRSKLQHLQQMAERIGGLVTITSERPKETSILFSFTNSNAVHPELDHLTKPMSAGAFKYAG
jgi:hypothetical protein